MAPIFTPDGTEVEDIILPDGSEAFEVIAPDGTVVFDDTDSVVYLMDEGSGTYLNNDVGSLDGYLSRDNWDTDSDFGNVTKYDGDFNGDDDADLGGSTERFWIGEENISFAMWVKITEASNFRPVAYSTQTQENRSGDEIENGWRLQIRPSVDDDGYVSIQYEHINNGDNESVGPRIDVDEEWLFVAVAMSGDDADVYIWNDDEQVGTTSGSESRGVVDDNYLNWMGDPNLDSNNEGFVAEVRAWRERLSESELQDVWEDTKP